MVKEEEEEGRAGELYMLGLWLGWSAWMDVCERDGSSARDTRKCSLHNC